MIDRLFGNIQAGIGVLVRGSVVIAVVVREIGAGDIESDAMARLKLIRGGTQLDTIFDDFASSHTVQ